MKRLYFLTGVLFLISVSVVAQHEIQSPSFADTVEVYEGLFDVLEPFAARIRGLFYGHIHVPSSTLYRGILCSSAPAAFSQFVFPDANPAPPLVTEPGGYSLVRMTHEQTWISHHENVIPRSPVHGD